MNFFERCIVCCLLIAGFSLHVYAEGQQEQAQAQPGEQAQCEASERYASGIGIRSIQGTGDTSPFEGEAVDNVVGVVSAIVPGRGFYIQEPRVLPSSDPSSPSFEEASSALFAMSATTPEFEVGDVLALSGSIVEEYQGGRDSGGLSTSSIRVQTIEVLDCSNTAEWSIEALTLGAKGRQLPDTKIFPDGLEFFERLENMLLRLPNPEVVGSTHTAFGEIAIAVDRGSGISGRNARGGATITANNENPEVFFIDLIESQAPLKIKKPSLPIIGDYYDGDIIGILSYSYGTYKVFPTVPPPPLVSGGLERETAHLPNLPGQGKVKLSIASFNVQNLSAQSPAKKFADLAETIVEALASPDIIAVQEVQDNNGEDNDGTVSAEQTWAMLISAMSDIDGPAYRWIDIPPQNNKDGGVPGANIRIGFLYNPLRVRLEGQPFLPAAESSAFAQSRKPLAAWFSPVEAGSVDGVADDGAEAILFINLHLSSKRGDAAPWGRNQPPRYASAEKRTGQTQAVADYIRTVPASIGRENDEVQIIVLGDMNEFSFRPALQVFENIFDGQSGLTNLAQSLPPEEHYSYVYQHNSQALDHIYASEGLLSAYSADIEYVHRYSEFLYGIRQSDHDPVLVHLR